MDSRKQATQGIESDSESGSEISPPIDAKALMNVPMHSLFSASTPPSSPATIVQHAISDDVPSPRRKASLKRLQAMTQFFEHKEPQQTMPASCPSLRK